MVEEKKELRVIPSEWELLEIGEIFEFKNGLNKEKKYFGSGTKIVNYMDVYLKRGLKSNDIKGKVNVSKSEIKAYEVKKGDVFFTRTSETPEEIGLTSVILEDIGLAVFSGFILRARPKNDILVDEYKKYCFSTKNVRNEIISQCSYTTRALTNGKLLSRISLLVPPLHEQQAMAEALSDVDNLIKSLVKLIEKKQKIKQGTMQELLTGKKRLSGFTGKWKMKKLGEVSSVYSGGTPLSSNPHYYGGEIPWITSGDLNQSIIKHVSGRITPAGLENSSAKMVKKETLLIAMYGATAGVAAITKIDAAINQAVLAILPDANNDSVFLYYQLNYLRNWIIKTYTQGGQPNLSGNIVKSLEITLPHIQEQQAIAQILRDMDAEIEALEQKLNKYKAIKQGMMQELLTGRVRLA